MLQRLLLRSAAHIGFALSAAAGLTCVPAIAAEPAAIDAAAVPNPQEHDFVLKDFRFGTGEVLPELRMHYRTLGTPRHDAQGKVTNAILLLHGTGGSSLEFFRPNFANVLLVPGGLLDPARYFIIIPDNIGYGKSSKPSDGLRGKFPHYDYDDMVEAQYRTLTEGFGIDHLRLIMGEALGCMQGFVWAHRYPYMASGVMGLACLPVELAGRNHMWRKMLINAIKNDPAYKNGEYTEEPRAGLSVVAQFMATAGGSAEKMQQRYPTRAAADAYLEETSRQLLDRFNANDLIRQIDASRNYNPEPDLNKIKIPVTLVNAPDDVMYPPEIDAGEIAMRRIPQGRYVVLPRSDANEGHMTHGLASVWQQHLKELLQRSEK